MKQRFLLQCLSTLFWYKYVIHDKYYFYAIAVYRSKTNTQLHMNKTVQVKRKDMNEILVKSYHFP